MKRDPNPPDVTLHEFSLNRSTANRQVKAWAANYSQALRENRLTRYERKDLGESVLHRLRQKIAAGAIQSDAHFYNELKKLVVRLTPTAPDPVLRRELAIERADEWVDFPEIRRSDSREEFLRSDLVNDATRADLILTSPSLELILALQRDFTKLDGVTWRAFEEIVAELLGASGWEVELQRGTKDGGADVIARKDDPQVGPILTIWQAKKLSLTRKVGLSVVKELADTRTQFGASKGVIVTSSYLTSGALERVVRDRYILGKIDRDDFWELVKNYRR